MLKIWILILGIMIGGLICIVLMCCLLINRDNELQNRINRAIEILKLCNSKCAKETIEILRGK